MTKQDLIEQMAGANLNKAEATRAVDAMVTGIKQALKKGDKVIIHGLGVFTVHKRAARKGRNPKTGESVDIPAKKTVKFKPATALKEAVR